MKKLLLVICISVFGTALPAQVSIESPDLGDRWGAQENANFEYLQQGDSIMVELKDGYVNRDGRMMTVMNGMTSVMKKETLLKNGTMLSVNGNYTAKEGKPELLKPDEHIDMEGKITRYQAQRELK